MADGSAPTTELIPLSLRAPAHLERDVTVVLAEVRRGVGLRAIGAALGLTDMGVRKWLLREVPAEFQELQTEGLIERVVEADRMLAEATDPVCIARAREIARFARMDLERRRPRLYGAKVELNGGDQPLRIEVVRFADDAAQQTLPATTSSGKP